MTNMNPRQERPIPEAGRQRFTRAQLKLATILGVALAGSILGHWALDNNFAETGIYFVAIPALMAIALTLIPIRGTEGAGFGTTRGTLIAILASALLVREGIICVIMAAPLIFLVIGLVRLANRSFGHKKEGRRQAAWAIPMMLIAGSADGVVYELPTAISVTETRVIDATADEFVASLGRQGQLPEIEPLLFALPFPAPTEFLGEGLGIGDTRTVIFGDAGSIDLTIDERTDNSITWTFTENTTPLAEWMIIHRATATWTDTAEGLAVTLTIDFDRALSPAFYFDPLQRWGVGEMAEVLLDMMAHNAVGADVMLDA